MDRKTAYSMATSALREQYRRITAEAIGRGRYNTPELIQLAAEELARIDLALIILLDEKAKE